MKRFERVDSERYPIESDRTGVLPLEQAQFVLVGEDHGIAQIPEFVGGLCDILAPQGFHTLAIEAGPLAAGELQLSLANRSTARTRVIDFERQFPNAIAFYDIREENDLLSRCAQAVGTKWGVGYFS